MGNSRLGGHFSWKLEGTNMYCWFVKSGEVREGTPDISLDILVLSENFGNLTEIEKTAIYFGFQRKIANSTTQLEKPTKDDCIDMFKSEYNRLEGTKKWNIEGKSSDVIKISKKAIAAISSLVELEAMEVLEKKGIMVMPAESKEKLAELRKVKKVNERKKK